MQRTHSYLYAGLFNEYAKNTCKTRISNFVNGSLLRWQTSLENDALAEHVSEIKKINFFSF